MEKRHSLEEACLEAEQIVTDLLRQQQQVEKKTEEVATELSSVDQQLASQSEELAGVESHLRALQGVLREDMGYGRSGEEESTTLKSCDGVQEAVAEWLNVPAGLDRAVEAVLNERVRGWFVDGPQSASRAITFLKGNDLGRGTFIPQSPRWTARVAGSVDWWQTLAGQVGVIGRAVDLIAVEGHRTAARDYLFDRVVFVETLQDATSLWEQQAWSAPDGPTFVTRAGEVLDAAGVVTGGDASSTGGLLQRHREVSQLESRLLSLGERVEEVRRQRQRLVEEHQSLREEGRRVVDALREAEMRGLSMQKDSAGIQQSLGDMTQRIETLLGDAQRGSLEVQRLEQEAHTGQSQLAQWVAEKTGQETALQGVRARLRQLDQGVQGVQQRLTEAQLAVQDIRSRREHRCNDLERIRQEQQEGVSRIETLRQQLVSLQHSIDQSRIERERQEQACREMGQAANDVKSQLVNAQERQAQDMAKAQEIETTLEAVRQAVSTLREQRMSVEVKRAEVRTQLGTVESTLSGTYEVNPASLISLHTANVHSEPMPDEAESAAASVPQSEEELRQQLQKIRERLDRMGPINLAAISEHQELEERHRFLSTQEQDLSTSIGSLKEIIQRINRTTKEMFATTFVELQEKFGEVFGKFFSGGRAELQLVEVPVDESAEGKGPQEPGVEIVAQPPGKRLKNITMLSGGEKTLTAMALLFASFLIRPTPFCILDEIDAPLDEENIGRFTTVLCELAQGAQFMVITHNKRTMGVADSVFGVTMEEPGISKLVSVRLTDLQPA